MGLFIEIRTCPLKMTQKENLTEGIQIASRTKEIAAFEIGQSYNDKDGAAWQVLNKTETSKSISRNYKKNNPEVYLTFKAEGDLSSRKDDEKIETIQYDSAKEKSNSDAEMLKLLLSVAKFVTLSIIV